MRFRRDIKGFTLGELLTVVMIIGILVGFALPVYANQIEKSREDNDITLVRAAYTEVYVAGLNGDFTKTVEVKLSQNVYDWQYHDTITIDEISHSKSDGDTLNWKGVPTYVDQLSNVYDRGQNCSVRTYTMLFQYSLVC